MAANISAQFSVVLTFGIILIFGYLAGRIAELCRLPKITGYITAGVLLEPSFLGLLPENFIAASGPTSNFALCIITYAIGGSLCYKRIRKLGKTILWMTVLEAEAAFLLVFAGLFFAMPLLARHAGMSVDPRFYLPLALFAGALASPTDPTAILAVREEYKTAGPVTTTVLGIAAFDDATGIINFSIAGAVCIAVLGIGGGVLGAAGTGLAATVLYPLAGILLSVLVGAVFGFLLLMAARKVEDTGVVIVLILGSLFACFGTAQLFKLNELMCTMVLGCVVVNFAPNSEKFFISIRDYIEELVFVVFFVLAGAHLQLGVLKSSLWIVLIFVVLRIVGKFGGVFLGGLISGAPAVVRKYTAFGLIPQGGIVVGLALLVRQDPRFADISLLLLNIILGTTVLFEFIGPIFAEVALDKAGEFNKRKK
ncbi:MAG: cation:proton antiporter [Candidatus Omnitrophota bacterium]